jgi:hypothetical protein
MNRISRASALAAAAALAGASAPPRQPVQPWTLDYGETACTALRVYGDPAEPVTFAMRPSSNGKVVRLVVARAGRAADARQFPVRTNLGGDGAHTTALRFGTRKAGPRTLIWINVARADLEALRRAGVVDLAGDGLHERFAVPKIGAVLDSMDSCNADLRHYWNVEAPPPHPAEPLKPLAQYFSDDDYPSQALFEHATGRSRVVMMIDETGMLKDCLVEETSGVAVLDAMTCDVLRERAKFRPAADAAGKPVKSVLTQGVVWRF